MIARREFGAAGPSLSVITYGSMRLLDGPQENPAQQADLLCEMHDHGIDTHHSSSEYDSYKAYLDALGIAAASGRRFRHIVKLSEPGWDSDNFDAQQITRNVDVRRAELGVDTIDVLQWMIRTPEASDAERQLRSLSRAATQINECLHTLIETQRIRSVAVFPYHRSVAERSLELTAVAGLCAYLNLDELDYADLAADGTPFLAIRPLAAGSLTSASSHPFPDILRFPLLARATASVLLSMKTSQHVNAATGALRGIEPDPQRFASRLSA